MALSLHDLRNLSDGEVVRRHDEQAKTAVVGTQYYLDELNRRYQERQTRETQRLTKCMTIMTAVITGAIIVNIVIGISGLIVVVNN